MQSLHIKLIEHNTSSQLTSRIDVANIHFTFKGLDLTIFLSKVRFVPHQLGFWNPSGTLDFAFK